LKKAIKLDFADWQAKARLLSPAATTQTSVLTHWCWMRRAGTRRASLLGSQRGRGAAGLPLPCLGLGLALDTQHPCSKHRAFGQAPVGRGENIKIFMVTETLSFTFF